MVACVELRSSKNTVRWPSGRRRTPGKCVSRKASRVRIPLSPPLNKKTGSLKPVFLCLNPPASRASDCTKRTEPILLHPDIHPHWLSLWPIFSVTNPWKRTHQVPLLRFHNSVKTTGYRILSWLVRLPILLPQNVSGKLSRLLMGSPVGHQNPNSFRCSSHNWGNGDIKSARVRVVGCVLLRILSCMSGASSIRRRTREA